MQGIYYWAIFILASRFAVTHIEIAKTATSFLLFWLNIVIGDVTFFLIVITNDLAKISLFCTSERFGIIFNSCDTAFLVLLFVAIFLVRLFFSFRALSVASIFCSALMALLWL